MEFTGISEAAFDFYEDLETDNSKVYWDSHKEIYQSAVRAPILALTEALAGEFGSAKIFRPFRDVRFAKDKTPYKTRQGAFVATGQSTGYYFEVGAPGVRVAAGFYHSDPQRLARIRKAIDGPDGGTVLKLIAALEKAGWTLGGETLKTAPRGYERDNPRIELLRHKAIVMNKSYGFAPFVSSSDLTEHVRKDWRAGRPLVEWFSQH
ncbi:MAG: DUF2461 domain-containing protein [Antricoccus sp.]